MKDQIKESIKQLGTIISEYSKTLSSEEKEAFNNELNEEIKGFSTKMDSPENFELLKKAAKKAIANKMGESLPGVPVYKF